MKRITMLFLSLFIVAGLMAQADNVLGVWYNQEKTGKIEIYKLNGKYFGKIVWLKNPYGEDGEPICDIKNPDPKLRTRLKMGLQIMNHFDYNANQKKWENGTIYDTANGNTYKCYMWFEGNQTNTLNVRGYIGISLIGRSQIWTRTTK